MTTIYESRDLEAATNNESNPFNETFVTSEAGTPAPLGFATWSESVTPFTESPTSGTGETETDRLLSEAFAEIRDETFDEAVAALAEETEQFVYERFTGETPAFAAERERVADGQLAGVRYESEQYLASLESGLTGMDLESLTEEQLDEVLERFDPQVGEVTPAGEEFIGGLVRKAKKVVKFVAKAAKTVGKVAGAVIGPVLKKLRKLINPLLRRVLSFAIGRLPAPLQPAARALATRITSETEEEFAGESPMSPANLTDVEALVDSFDAVLAEAVTNYATDEAEMEAFADSEEEFVGEGRELQSLAEARSALIDRLRAAGEDEDLAPAIEQFVPALLGALRLGITLIGRPKVVGFLAKYLARLIGKWVGPKLSGPLSNAIVDIGMRLISLEHEAGQAGERTDEAAPVALASVIEDTVRRLSENEDYIFENEDLLQLALAEAAGEAVATHFPQQFVRPDLQLAPSLGGTFVARQPRRVRTYHKYNRTPEVELTAQIADSLPSFGGSTVGASLRAAGVTLPMRARLHVYQAAVGTSLPRMIRVDRSSSGGRRYATSSLHPLTPEAAGVLLREPRLGVAVPAAFLQSRNRVAAGQRFYILEPIGSAAARVPTVGTGGTRTATPSRVSVVVNVRKSQISVRFYFSESEAQRIVAAIRGTGGAVALLQALAVADREIYRSVGGSRPLIRIVREDREDFDNLAIGSVMSAAPAIAASLRARLRRWMLPALAAWARTNAEAFARAAAHPDEGVTIRVRLASVPGLTLMRSPASAAARGRSPVSASSGRGTPTVTIVVTPGRR